MFFMRVTMLSFKCIKICPKQTPFKQLYLLLLVSDLQYLWIGRKIPWFNAVFANFDEIDVLHASHYVVVMRLDMSQINITFNHFYIVPATPYLWIGRKIPWLNAVFSDFNEIDVLHSRHNVVVMRHH